MQLSAGTSYRESFECFYRFFVVEECRDYPTLKAALLQAYSVVPEVCQKRFRNLSKLYTDSLRHILSLLSV